MKTFAAILALLCLAVSTALAAPPDTPAAVPIPLQSSSVKVAVGPRTITAQATYTPPAPDTAPALDIQFSLTTMGFRDVWYSLTDEIAFHVGIKTYTFPTLHRSMGMGGTAIETLTAQIPRDQFASIFSAKRLTITLDHNPVPPFEPGYTETYPFDAPALTPFQAFLKTLATAK